MASATGGRGLGRLWRAAAAFGALLALAGPAAAQSVDCARLAREIAAFDRRGAGEAQRYARAAERQRVEIERTVAYGVSIGCWRPGFFTRAPEACAQIDDRVGRMRANLDQLYARADADVPRGGGVDRETLRMEYDAWCRGRPRDQRALRDPFAGRAPPGLRRVPLDEPWPEEPLDPLDDMAGTPPDDAPGQSAGARAICVRSCDGGYFPLSVTARQSRLVDLQELCRASCPNVEARLYTLPEGGGVADAVSATGELYSAHPKAFLFRKKYDPACACKPAGKNWGQVLQEAEKIIGKETGAEDQTLTPQEADALSRPGGAAAASAPGAVAPAPGGAPARRDRKATTPPAPAQTAPTPAPAAPSPTAQPAAPAGEGETREV
ncbi:MAG: DUF2865 domain-containing protein, partial [Methylobacteriaceae bacterium]|nr:DUF2865 domain-containing protein [Methylobacteriaceae bacterium]